MHSSIDHSRFYIFGLATRRRQQVDQTRWIHAMPRHKAFGAGGHGRETGRHMRYIAARRRDGPCSGREGTCAHAGVHQRSTSREGCYASRLKMKQRGGQREEHVGGDGEDGGVAPEGVDFGLDGQRQRLVLDFGDTGAVYVPCTCASHPTSCV